MRSSIAVFLFIIVVPVLSEHLILNVSPAQLILATTDTVCARLVQLVLALLMMNLKSLYRLLSYPQFDFSPCWTLPSIRENSNGSNLLENDAILDTIKKAGGQLVLRWLIPLKIVQMTPLGSSFLQRHLSTGELLSPDYPLDDLDLSSLSSKKVETFLKLLLKHPIPTLGSPGSCRHIFFLGNLQFLGTQSLWSLINTACLRESVTRAGQWFQEQYIQFARLLQAAALQDNALADLAFYRLVALASWSQGNRIHVVCAELLTIFQENPSVLQRQVLNFFDSEQEPNVRKVAFTFIQKHMSVPPKLQPIFALEHLLVALLSSLPIDLILPALHETLASYTPRQVPAFMVRSVLGQLSPEVYRNYVAPDLPPLWASPSDTLSRRITDFFPSSLLGPEERLNLFRRQLKLQVLERTEFIHGGRIEYLRTGLLGETDPQDNITVAKLIEEKGELVTTIADGTIRFVCSRKHKEHLIVWWRGRLLQLLIYLRPLPVLSDTLRRIFRSKSELNPPHLEMADVKDICIQWADGDDSFSLRGLARLLGELSKIGWSIFDIVDSSLVPVH